MWWPITVTDGAADGGLLCPAIPHPVVAALSRSVRAVNSDVATLNLAQARYNCAMDDIGDSHAGNAPVVLVVGGNGFLGGFVVAALRAQGWQVLRGVRPRAQMADDERACDFAHMHRASDWHAVLAGVDAVVDAAGILREEGAQTFEAIHVTGPAALAQACVDVGVTRFIQLSALGIAEDGEFIASKHRFDDALLALPLKALVLRPSVVFAVAGSYGGTSLLRALAAFPGWQVLPGDGRWLIQPVAAEDLGELIARALATEGVGIYEVGGPEPMTLREYQTQWRRWLGLPGERAWHVPDVFVSLQVWLGERLGRGPVGETMWRMLRRGNITATGAHARLQEDFGIAPSALADVLKLRPSQVQDRWQAQLYFLAPTLRLCIAALWLLSAWAGFATSATTIEVMASGTALMDFAPVTLARTGGVVDGLLGLWLLSGWRPRTALALMAISVLAYTVIFGALLPSAWLDPLGGLAKNLVVLPALAVLWVLVDRR